MTESPLKLRVQEEMKAALRAGDKRRLGTLRLFLAALKQREIDERIVLDDAQCLAIVDKMIKQRRDSIAQYQAANRQELVDQEAFEIEVLQEYLPTQLTDAEVDALIETAFAQSAATTMKEMGKVMAIIKPQAQGRADMGQISAKIKARLQAS